MVAYSATIANALGVLCQPTNRWGTMIWGTNYWGEQPSNSLPLTVIKRLYHTIDSDPSLAFTVYKRQFDSITFNSEVGKHTTVRRDNGLTLSDTRVIIPYKWLHQSITFDDNIGKQFTKEPITNTLTCDGDTPTIYKQDGNYFYEFPAAGNNASTIYIPSYSSSTITSLAWTTESTSSPVWG